MIRALLTFVAMMAMTGMAYAQQQLQLPEGLLNAPVDGSVASWIIRTFGLLTILSVAPGILIMVTSFPRFVIAFSILRSGMGLATTPSNMILVSLALFMTFYVMAPTFDRAWQNGVEPLIANQIDADAVAANVERLSALPTEDTIHLPSAEKGVSSRIPVRTPATALSERKVVHRFKREDVRKIDSRFCHRLDEVDVGVGHRIKCTFAIVAGLREGVRRTILPSRRKAAFQLDLKRIVL